MIFYLTGAVLYRNFLKFMQNSPRGVGACWSVVYRCMNKKIDAKGYFYRAGQCAALSSFRVGKKAIFVGKGYVFLQFLLKVAEESRHFNLLHWKGLLFDWTQRKGVSISKCRTLFGVSFAFLC